MTPEKALQHLRDICLSLPETRETVKWGHPTFEGGKSIFAVLDEYSGRHCIAFRCGANAFDELIADSRFFPAPYTKNGGWVCLDIGERFRIQELRNLLTNSYRCIALKRMLKALDGTTDRS